MPTTGFNVLLVRNFSDTYDNMKPKEKKPTRNTTR
ncbi:MAG: hypothetical protein A4E58_01206 [Syntrophorhabdus sp. PtaB.Bin006]|nr:MAG: hypothetical protein A4E58_01206 [Syntrophorhabdus sp. PtaB.Bin006]